MMGRIVTPKRKCVVSDVKKEEIETGDKSEEKKVGGG